MANGDERLELRVIEAAEAALAARGFATAIDVLAGLRWLPSSSERACARAGSLPRARGHGEPEQGLPRDVPSGGRAPLEDRDLANELFEVALEQERQQSGFKRVREPADVCEVL